LRYLPLQCYAPAAGFSSPKLLFRISFNDIHADAGLTMPTVLRLLNWRFHFYSNEGHEPPHIHVRTGDGECKFWLSPVRLARVEGVRANEVRRIEVAVIEHESLFLEKWHEHRNA
jgi:hypothetical protein